jgi:hypothetical protein
LRLGISASRLTATGLLRRIALRLMLRLLRLRLILRLVLLLSMVLLRRLMLRLVSVLLVLRILRRSLLSFLIFFPSGLLEFLDTSSKSATNLRELPRTEDNDDDYEDDGQLPWADWHIPDPLIQ